MDASEGSTGRRNGCGCQNRFGIPCWLGLVNLPPILELILVLGLGCSLGVRDFDPRPNPFRAVLVFLIGEPSFGWFLQGNQQGKPAF